MVHEAAQRLTNTRRNAWLLQTGSATSAVFLAVLLTILAGREPEGETPLFAQQLQPLPLSTPTRTTSAVKTDLDLKPARNPRRNAGAAIRPTRLTSARR